MTGVNRLDTGVPTFWKVSVPDGRTARIANSPNTQLPAGVTPLTTGTDLKGIPAGLYRISGVVPNGASLQIDRYSALVPDGIAVCIIDRSPLTITTLVSYDLGANYVPVLWTADQSTQCFEEYVAVQPGDDLEQFLLTADGADIEVQVEFWDGLPDARARIQQLSQSAFFSGLAGTASKLLRGW